jgi:tetratricopeptide (TPR) repeat protein
MVAYDYFLRARDKLNRGTERIHFREAIELLHKAIGEDPDFTVAFATLAQTHTSLYWYYHNRQELDSAQRIFDLILDEDQMLPELQLALGSYYTLVETSYERATVALDNARMALGESSDLYQQTAYLAKRQGNWNKTLADARMALELDPRSAIKCLDLADSYMMLGNYDKADAFLDRAISVGSPSGDFFFFKIQNSLLEHGSIDSARKIVQEASQYMDPARVIALGSKTTLEVLGLWRFNLITEDLESLPRRFENLFDSPRRHVYYMSRGQIAELIGQPELMQVYYDSARVHSKSLAKKYPEDFHFTIELAIINSMAGRHDEAIEAGLRAKELMPIDLCHW